MSTRNLVEEQETFEAGIIKWQEMEDLTIATCDEILAATDNKLVTTIAGIIKSDSTKHKMVLGVVQEALNGTITLTPDELGELSGLLEKHRDLEKDTVELAAEQLELSRNFVVNHLVSYLLEDERKHYMLLHQLNDFKKKLYPYA
ncbi:MAG: hypothetical protein HZB44_05290 [Actinobacteria bacterium]|nr:hypothetical protein [Actinomycetota bacterium]